MTRRTYSGGVVKRTVLSGGVVERTVLSGGVVERTVLSGGVAPEATGPVLIPPAWVTHAWEHSGQSDGSPISADVDIVSAVSVSASGTDRPVYRADYASTGVPAAEYNGSNFLESAANIDLTGGYVHVVLAHLTSNANFRILFEQGAEQEAVCYSDALGRISILERDDTFTQIRTGGGATTLGAWRALSFVQNGALSKIYSGRTEILSGTVERPTVANTIRFGKSRGGLSTGGFLGGIAGHYFGPPGATLTELWDYLEARFGVTV